MKSSNSISTKSPVGKVIGHVKRLTMMESSLAALLRDKRRVDSIYDESIDALREWEKQEHDRLDKLEETVRNRYESMEVDSCEVVVPQIPEFLDNVYCSSGANRLIDEVDQAL